MAITAPVPLIAVSEKSAITRALEKYFYCFMSVFIAVVVFYGFSFTVNKNLVHPAIHRPWILWLHGIVFSGWLLFFILQSALVRARSVRWHRNVGWFGAALGAGIFVLGISTTLTMARYYVHELHRDEANLLVIPLWDISCFAVCFALAIAWRKKLEHHRRLMLLATCALSAAGWGRLPILPPGTFLCGCGLFDCVGRGARSDCEQTHSCGIQVRSASVCCGTSYCSLHSGDQARVVGEDRIRNRGIAAINRAFLVSTCPQALHALILRARAQ